MSVLRNLSPTVSSLCKTNYILLILITVSNSIFQKLYISDTEMSNIIMENYSEFHFFILFLTALRLQLYKWGDILGKWRKEWGRTGRGRKAILTGTHENAKWSLKKNL